MSFVLIGLGIWGYNTWQKNNIQQSATQVAATQDAFEQQDYAQQTATRQAIKTKQYPFSKDLELDSPLNRPDKKWGTLSQQGDSCTFQNSAYHVAVLEGYVVACTADGNFANPTYEIITNHFQGAGESAYGLFFGSRTNFLNIPGLPSIDFGYAFLLTASGKWRLSEYHPSPIDPPVEGMGASFKEITSGPLPQGVDPRGKNKLAIAADGEALHLYLNDRLLSDKITGKEGWSGVVGVIATSTQGGASIDYTQAKVWDH